MRHRFTRRRFLQHSASTVLAASVWAEAMAAAPAAPSAEREWRVYGGDAAGTRYSPLDQINRANVSKLRVAWTYHTGDSRAEPATTIACNPLAVEGVLYLTTAERRVTALEAATGKLIWQFDPFQGSEDAGPRGAARSVTYWQSGNDRRVLFVARARLYALDAKTGKPVSDFGQGGSVDLRHGVGRDIGRLAYDVAAPGIIYKNLIVLGSQCGAGPEPSAPGHVRAFDVRTGVMAWIFHTIPRPGKFGNDTWQGEAWRTAGGASSTGGMTLDERRGWVFVSTSAPAFDFYGGQRLGANAFANSVIALEASTGKRVWHYQAVHHDLWNRGLPGAPALATLKLGGKRVNAVVQPTPLGQLLVLDRQTGAPLFPVEERPVPASDVPGEQAWPTQPQVLKPPPYARQAISEDDITEISTDAHAYALDAFKKLRAGAWQPPSVQGTIVFPGAGGGAKGGGAFDPTTGWYYINSQDVPSSVALEAAPAGVAYPFTATSSPFVDREGYPAIKPPWGQLAALDLNRGEMAWQTVLGEFTALVARGLPPTGTPNTGEPIVTAGGLVFIAATQDECFRAFDRTSGKVLWKTSLPAAGYATPCTYEAGGKQYVVIAAGDAYVAFALP